MSAHSPAPETPPAGRGVDEAGAAVATVVTVELFGMPRLLAGARAVTLPWRPGLTLGDLPALLAAACPALAGRVAGETGALAGGLVFNLGGRDFVRDPATPLHAGDWLLLLSADPGG